VDWVNAFQIHRTDLLTTSRITLKTHFFMILHQFNAKKKKKKIGIFSLFF